MTVCVATAGDSLGEGQARNRGLTWISMGKDMKNIKDRECHNPFPFLPFPYVRSANELYFIHSVQQLLILRGILAINYEVLSRSDVVMHQMTDKLKWPAAKFHQPALQMRK